MLTKGASGRSLVFSIGLIRSIVVIRVWERCRAWFLCMKRKKNPLGLSGIHFMKWFKHLTGSLDDPFIYELMDQFGSFGYVCFFRILEVYSNEFRTDPNWKLKVTRSYLKSKLHKRQDKLVLNCLKVIANSGKWEIDIDDKYVTIYINKFRRLLDDSTLRKIRAYEKKFGIGSEKVLQEEEKEEEKEIKTDEPEKAPAPKVTKMGDWMDNHQGMKIYITKFEKTTWKKIRTAIGEALKKNKHPKAIQDLILYIYKHQKRIPDPQTYFWGALNKISGNYYEQENISKHEKTKLDEIPTIGAIFERMTKELK